MGGERETEVREGGGDFSFIEVVSLVHYSHFVCVHLGFDKLCHY